MNNLFYRIPSSGLYSYGPILRAFIKLII